MWRMDKAPAERGRVVFGIPIIPNRTFRFCAEGSSGTSLLRLAPCCSPKPDHMLPVCLNRFPHCRRPVTKKKRCSQTGSEPSASSRTGSVSCPSTVSCACINCNSSHEQRLLLSVSLTQFSCLSTPQTFQGALKASLPHSITGATFAAAVCLHSSGIARVRSAPDVAQAARWSPSLSRRPRRQLLVHGASWTEGTQKQACYRRDPGRGRILGAHQPGSVLCFLGRCAPCHPRPPPPLCGCMRRGT